MHEHERGLRQGGVALPDALISCDWYHGVAMAIEAMDQVRRTEMAEDAQAVRSVLGRNDSKAAKQLMWGTRRNPSSWSGKQADVMHWLQRSMLKSDRAVAAEDGVARGLRTRQGA